MKHQEEEDMVTKHFYLSDPENPPFFKCSASAAAILRVAA